MFFSTGYPQAFILAFYSSAVLFHYQRTIALLITAYIYKMPAKLAGPWDMSKVRALG